MKNPKLQDMKDQFSDHYSNNGACDLIDESYFLGYADGKSSIHVGKVSRITLDDSYVYLDEHLSDNNGRYFASLSLIPGYLGQSAKELGIKVGTLAWFTTDENNHVEKLHVFAKPRKRWRLVRFSFISSCCVLIYALGLLTSISLYASGEFLLAILVAALTLFAICDVLGTFD
jgi:hypothetical protein